MDKLAFLQAVESKLGRGIERDSQDERTVYQLYDEGENVAYVVSLFVIPERFQG